MRRCSLLGAEFLPVDLQAHAPNNAYADIALSLGLVYNLQVEALCTKSGGEDDIACLLRRCYCMLDTILRYVVVPCKSSELRVDYCVR